MSGARGWEEDLSEVCLHLPELPPSCLMQLRFIWLYRKRPMQCAGPCVGFLLAWQLCVWCWSWFPVRLGPVDLESVMSESLKRLGQFREDKWWVGRTADVGTQTLQDDRVDGGHPHHHHCPHDYTLWWSQCVWKKSSTTRSFFRSFTWVTLLLSSKQMIKNDY